MKDMIMDVLRGAFKPEFLNRIDDIVIFGQLSKKEIEKIIDVQLEKLRKNLAERGISIVLEDSAKVLLSNEGYDPMFGARPLKRAIQTLIQNPLAIKLLNGEIKSGSVIHVADVGGAMQFTPEKIEAAAS